MKIKFRKYIIFAILFNIICFCVFATVDSYSWYFKPAKSNTQPEVIPETKSFIDDYDTIYLGSPETNKIYLTFDAGYENGNVKKILDTLKEKEVTAAFFILPQIVSKNPELIQQMKDNGHLICNHTKSHRNMSKITDFESFEKELIEAENILFEKTGFKMDKFYRPPEGRFSKLNLEFADKLGYTTVFWSVAYADWDNNNQLNPSRALELLVSRTHNGAVILLHPNSSTNAEIIGSYIDKMKAAGYEFCSLTEFERNIIEDVEE